MRTQALLQTLESFCVSCIGEMLHSMPSFFLPVTLSRKGENASLSRARQTFSNALLEFACVAVAVAGAETETDLAEPG